MRPWASAGLALFVLASSHSAAAEPEETATNAASSAAPEPDQGSDEPEAIVPPRPLETRVAIPESPQKPVAVLLELLIDTDGHVAEAQALEGPEPYRAAALQAARAFRFAPALRRGRPVSAKIRFLLRFEPEQPLPEPESQPEPAPAALPTKPKSPAASTPGTFQVVVTGVRPAYARGVVTRAEAREIPGTFGDPLRAIEASPGVMPIFSGVPFFFVRGAPPGNVGFFLDGIRVPLLYHALLGPSVVHPALIDHVNLYRGAAPSQFGRYAGAIVSAETREPLARAGGEGNVRIFDAGALAETPFAGGDGHVLAGGRYSYTALIASLLSGATLQYWDYQTRVDYQTKSAGRLGLLAFGAYDNFQAEDQSIERGAGTQFHRIDLRDDFTGERTRARVAVTVGYDRTGSPAGALFDKSIATRSLVTHQLSDEVELSYGHDVSLDTYSLDLDLTSADANDLSLLFPRRTDIAAGAFAEIGWAPASWVTLAPGTRVDTYRISQTTATSVDGRLSVTFRPKKGLSVIEAVGYVHQPPNYVPQVPAAQVGIFDGKLQKALQASSGLSVDLIEDTVLSATAFQSQFYDLVDPIGSDRDLTFDPEAVTRRKRGSSIGLELELRRPLTRRFGGFLSYTLSRTERSSGSHESLSAFDRPHVLQGALAFNLGNHWRAGTRIAYYSGVPARSLEANTTDIAFVGNRRAPAFFRLDLRLEKRWAIKEHGYWALVAEMLNATMDKEVTSRNCVDSRCTDEVSGPIAIPSIGVEAYYY